MKIMKCRAPFKEKVRFIKFKKNYALNYYPCLGIGEQKNYTPVLDVLVIGSDEVFNCVQNNSNIGFAPELFGVGNKAKRLVSFAASFGNTTLQKLENYKIKDTIAEWLNKFDAISVRDANTLAIVEQLTKKKPDYNIDPVIAYDFINKCKDIPVSISESKYMILYGYTGRFTKEECCAIRAYADKKNLKVFCLGGVQACCDRFIDCHPFYVIAYFQHAECVVTDTFHGTIFSVITHQEFVSFVRSGGYGNYEKLTDLLNKLHLPSRIVYNVNQLPEFFKTKIDYTITDAVIKNEREDAKRYLERQIQIDG